MDVGETDLAWPPRDEFIEHFAADIAPAIDSVLPAGDFAYPPAVPPSRTAGDSAPPIPPIRPPIKELYE